MHVTLSLIPCEYRPDGQVVAFPMRCATRTSFEAKNAAEIITAADRMHASHDGTHDAVISVSHYSGTRKVSGFDTKVKAHVRGLYCKRNPIWDVV